jgi:hypothetical protein
MPLFGLCDPCHARQGRQEPRAPTFVRFGDEGVYRNEGEEAKEAMMFQQKRYTPTHYSLAVVSVIVLFFKRCNQFIFSLHA